MQANWLNLLSKFFNFRNHLKKQPFGCFLGFLARLAELLQY